jgi:DNA-directed RNA polymerase subunit RPC12/RpoP
MNRDCHGDLVEVEGRTYYRCMLDGKFMEASASIDGTGCPNCGRMVVCQPGVSKTNVRTVKEVQFDDRLGWVRFEVTEAKR